MTDPNFPKDGRTVEAPDGLPPGWTCIEKMYLTGTSAGKTYIRFTSPNGKHKALGSVLAAIKLQAKDDGRNPDEAVAEYEAMKKAKAEAAQKAREEAGILKGQQREDSIEKFRAKFGPLDGSIVHAFSGWLTRWDYAESCNQTHVTYTDPDGKDWKLLKDIEACLQSRIDRGQDLTEFIKSAKRLADPTVFTACSQRARVEGTCEHSMTQVAAGALEKAAETAAERRGEARGRAAPREPAFVESLIAVARAKGAPNQALSAAGDDPADIQKLLSARGFEDGVEMVIVHSGEEHLCKLHGLYYQMPVGFNGRPSYQKVLKAPGCQAKLACAGHYVFWCSQRKRWQIGPLDDGSPGYACSSGDAPKPYEVAGAWTAVQKLGADDGSRDRSRTPAAVQKPGADDGSRDRSRTPARVVGETQTLVENEGKARGFSVGSIVRATQTIDVVVVYGRNRQKFQKQVIKGQKGEVVELGKDTVQVKFFVEMNKGPKEVTWEVPLSAVEEPEVAP